MNELEEMGALECLMANNANIVGFAWMWLKRNCGAEGAAIAKEIVRTHNGNRAVVYYGSSEYSEATERMKTAVNSGKPGTNAAIWLFRSGDSGMRKAGIAMMEATLHRFIYRCAQKWYPTYFSKEADDLYSCGMIGVIQAMEKYDGKSAFTTYCVNYIKAEMFHYISSLNGSGTPYYGKIDNKVSKAVAKMEKDGTEPTTDNVAKETGLSRKIVEESIKSLSIREKQSAKTAEDDHLEAPDNVEDAVLKMLETDILRDLVRRLDKDEQQIIISRFWLEETFPEIGMKNGKGYTETRKTYRKALKVLRKLAEAEG